MTRPELRIDETVFRRNLAVLRDRVEPSSLMLVVKDDAYGHGAGWAAETAVRAGVDWVGTYDIPTAVGLRDAIGSGPRLFAWATSADDEIAEALIAGVDLGVGSLAYLERVLAQSERVGARARIHLKIDTGLHRSGLSAGEWAHGLDRVLGHGGHANADLVGVWSHIAEASDEEDDAAHRRFLGAVDEAARAGASSPLTHLTASAATWARPELRGSLVRVGAFCYGIRSADGPELPGLAPIASLCARVEEVRDGEAVVGIGALDGIPSILAGRVDVGTPAGPRPLRAVELATVHVEAWPGAVPGDEVVLFGPGTRGESSATTLAESIDTVGEEILTRLASRVRRRHVS